MSGTFIVAGLPLLTFSGLPLNTALPATGVENHSDCVYLVSACVFYVAVLVGLACQVRPFRPVLFMNVNNRVVKFNAAVVALEVYLVSSRAIEDQASAGGVERSGINITVSDKSIIFRGDTVCGDIGVYAVVT